MSCACLPIVIALVHKLLDRDEKQLSTPEIVLLGVSFSLMITWSLSAIILVPAFLLLIPRTKSLFCQYRLRMLAVVLVVLHLPWIVLFVQVSDVGRFISLKRPVIIENRDQGLTNTDTVLNLKATARSVRGGHRHITLKRLPETVRGAVTKVNPLIIFLSLPGLLLLRRRGSRNHYIALSLWLLFLGLVVSSYRPQLELDRMLMVLWLLLTIPSAEAIYSTIRNKQQNYFIPSLLCGFAFAGIFSSSSIVNNRTIERYGFMDDSVMKVATAIRSCPNQGRTVFAGFILHQLSGGHIAPFPLFTDKPIVASTPFHNVWWYTDLVPEVFKKRGKSGIEEYLDLMNASCVVAHEPVWIKFFNDNPEKYSNILSHRRFNVYTRNSSYSYFLEGDGEILEQGANKLRIKMKSSEAILKFNYFSFLESNMCQLSENKLEGGLSFIKIHDCAPGTELSIKGKTGFRRLF